ncbi:MAG TPA: metalloregulator ArsR/SmtB family transcription factor [Phycisphaerales bacterium]|nr:metalloregulator ArsR/SmtB family transcription factor [Phycisphaerales bacterium]
MHRAAADQSVFHAIADPTRRAILDALRGGEATASDLMDAAAGERMTQPAFSQHLRVLREAGLIAARKEGRARVYRFNPEPLSEVAVWMSAYDKFWEQKLDALGAHLARVHGAKKQG